MWNGLRDFVSRGRINIVNLLSNSMDLNNHQDNGMSSGQGLSIIPTIHRVTWISHCLLKGVDLAC